MEPPSHQTFVLCGVLVVAGLGCSFCLVLESHAWLCKGISWSPFALLPAKEGLGPLSGYSVLWFPLITVG